MSYFDRPPKHSYGMWAAMLRELADASRGVSERVVPELAEFALRELLPCLSNDRDDAFRGVIALRNEIIELHRSAVALLHDTHGDRWHEFEGYPRFVPPILQSQRWCRGRRPLTSPPFYVR